MRHTSMHLLLRRSWAWKPGFTAPLFLALACGAAQAQPAPQRLEFEVATIKPSPPPGNGPMFFGQTGGPGTSDPGRFTTHNTALSDLIVQAYGVQRYQVVRPDWVNAERFDVTAKLPAGTTKEQFRLMLQSLLADRFGLKVHHEQKEMQEYALTVGKNGPKMKESAVTPETEPDKAKLPPPPPGPPKIGADGFPVLPAGRPMMVMMNGNARMQMYGETMEQLANRLSGQLGKPVTDETGLKGKYDYALTYSVDAALAGGPGLPPPPPGALGGGPAGGAVIAGGPGGGPPGAGGADRVTAPTLTEAVQQQLGLKLEQKKGMVDIVVVDHIEKTPTEN